MSDVKRYNLEDYLGLQIVHEQEDGKFVLYEDHRAVIESIINDEAVLGDHNIIPSYKAEVAALLARHNAMVEVVAWDRECGTVSFTDLWFDEWNRTEDQSKSAMRELRLTRRAARVEVDRLLGDIK